MNFVKYGVINLNHNDRIILGSDGVADVLKGISADVLLNMTAEQIVNASQGIDDKTVIIIEEK